MKKLLLLIIILSAFFETFANHIAGGELFYEYIGPGATANTKKYKLTMRLFRDCHSTGQVLTSETVVIGVYENSTQTLRTSVPLSREDAIEEISLNTSAIPCLINAPEVCFQIGIFTGTVDLPASQQGYTLSWIRCCRAEDIANLSVSTGIGATFTTSIPGTIAVPTGNNSSPQFAVKDTALVCQNKNFELDFGATDPDNDSLSYEFCDAYSGGTSSAPNPAPPSSLNLSPLPYQSPFSGTSPLGADVTINATSGKITGKAPGAGRYVINVCVTEWRDGKAINVHRKDFILEIGNCNYAASEPTPVTGAYCSDFTVPFSNSSSSSSIQSYFWDFGVPGIDTDTSSLPNPSYQYSDTGVFEIKLIVRGSAGCVDTGRTTLGVFPGFDADFNSIGSCYKTPFNFKDQTITKYGFVNSWSWNFGDLSSNTDVSTIQSPTYQYSTTGNRSVTLIATSSKGCRDTVTKVVNVTDVPLLRLPFHDTLICSVDTLALKAEGSGNFNWSPAYNITNPNTAFPLVYPKDTTVYVVTLEENGCTAQDSIKVNTLDFVSVNAGADTTICTTDAVTLKPISHALQYSWTPTEAITGDPHIKNPVVKPLISTTYFVTANLGKCQATDDISIKVVDYPKANAGADTIICYGGNALLGATITGASFNWTPTTTLSNPGILTPVASPTNTTTYVLTVRDTLGCPKPASDAVVVTVVPPVKAFAGNDTNIVANQPLQLNATGGESYFWTPSIGLSNTSIANPLVTLGPSYDSIIYKVTVTAAGGCFAEDDIKVKVFKTPPDIFIPTAFTPNSDGKNDILKPIPVGIRDFTVFRIFNRWGQLIYSTSRIGDGWDGTLNGVKQATGTYVFMADAVDYLGKPLHKKGTVVLIR